MWLHQPGGGVSHLPWLATTAWCVSVCVCVWCQMTSYANLHRILSLLSKHWRGMDGWTLAGFLWMCLCVADCAQGRQYVNYAHSSWSFVKTNFLKVWKEAAESLCVDTNSIKWGCKRGVLKNRIIAFFRPWLLIGIWISPSSMCTAYNAPLTWQSVCTCATPACAGVCLRKKKKERRHKLLQCVGLLHFFCYFVYSSKSTKFIKWSARLSEIVSLYDFKTFRKIVFLLLFINTVKWLCW